VILNAHSSGKIAAALTEQELSLLERCDGVTDINPEDAKGLARFIERGFVAPCAPGNTPADYQKFKFCDNRFFPYASWAITGRCDMNCKHCFNAADESRDAAQFNWEQCLRVIDELEDCGVLAVTLFGGEPMFHPRFLDIALELHKRGIVVNTVVTNGSFATPELISVLQEINPNMTFRISFDGLGHHDWLRNKEGAEEKALESISALCQAGFYVQVNFNVWKGNEDCVLDSVRRLDSLGVSNVRLVRTSEAPRWNEKFGGKCLSLDEYTDLCMETMRAYVAEPHRASLNCWQLATVYPMSKTWHQGSAVTGPESYRDSIPGCRGIRHAISITASGDLVPCQQMAGYFKAHGIHLGNMLDTPLRELLQEGPYIDAATLTISEVRDKNENCKACEFWKICNGGCRALAILLSEGGYTGYNPLACYYFKGGWTQKIADMLGEGWTLDDPK
jgi:radical SAM protein with 4Fe4S-binding SPASM domain